MAITVADLLNEVKHASGSPKASQFVNQLSIVQQAGDYLDTMHPWEGMVRKEVSLDSVGGQDFIVLPSDVRDIITIQHSLGTTNWFQFISHERMTKLLAYNDNDQDYVGGHYAARFLHPTEAGPVDALRLYPRPAESATGVFLMCYRARAVPTAVGLQADTDYIIIPNYLEILLRDLCRIFARGIEEEDQGTIHVRLEAMEQSAYLRRTKERDGALQPDIGGIQGGAAMYRTYETHWWDNAVESPS